MGFRRPLVRRRPQIDLSLTFTELQAHQLEDIVARVTLVNPLLEVMAKPTKEFAGSRQGQTGKAFLKTLIE